ncbi:MAG TPA: hypothetical protein VFF26_01535 [Gallionella sp.]|nr:hypothetical protein [Gallionella sp.]
MSLALFVKPLHMQNMRTFILLLSLNLLGGCSVLQGGKLLAPESFGLIQAAPNIYVESGTDEAMQAQLRDAMAKAESAIGTAYGSVKSRPVVYACMSETCFTKFGGRGAERAKVFGNNILLSPRGLNWHYLAHEWSHDEIRTRLAFTAWWHMPQWFDEGVAVAISEAPENAESHWQYLISANVSRPTREELHAVKSLSQWGDAVRRYGETQNLERKARGEPEVRPLYTAAGHELRPWLAKVGTSGFLAFIAQLNEGKDFESAYRTIDLSVERDTPPAELLPSN